jgi:NADPH-dependent 2,4-dienoyl-CoA reductase/sulfur reductase-like enzyme
MIVRRTDLAAYIQLYSGESPKIIQGTINGPNAKLGHQLRQGGFLEPKVYLKHDIVIIGGGIAGLSAARKLNQSGADFVAQRGLLSKGTSNEYIVAVLGVV